jgi:putative endonuclease
MSLVASAKINRVKSKPFYAYIVKCSDGSFYTGYTDNLEVRLREHNGLLVGGARYTRSHRPVELVYSEPFQTRTGAQRREREIKKMSHKEKEIVINNNINNNL